MRQQYSGLRRGGAHRNVLSKGRPVSGKPCVEPAGRGRGAEGVRRTETVAHAAGEALQGGDDPLQPLLVRPAAEAAAEGWKAGAEDQRQVELGGAAHDGL